MRWDSELITLSLVDVVQLISWNLWLVTIDLSVLRLIGEFGCCCCEDLPKEEGVTSAAMLYFTPLLPVCGKESTYM